MRECEKYLFELLCELIIEERKKKKKKFGFLRLCVYQHLNASLTRSKMFDILIQKNR